VPKLLKRVEPDLSDVARPYPCGVVILEIGIDERGEVVSSCVLHSVRADFDKAAQAATRKWRWTVSLRKEKPIGLVMTVTVLAPNGNCEAR
jgi:TonB family protein